MEPISHDEFNKVKDDCTRQDLELQKIKEWLHFPPDIGPAEHVTDHVLMKEKKNRKTEIQSHVMKSLVVASLVFLFGLLILGAKQWFFLQSQ